MDQQKKTNEAKVRELWTEKRKSGSSFFNATNSRKSYWRPRWEYTLDFESMSVTMWDRQVFIWKLLREWEEPIARRRECWEGECYPSINRAWRDAWERCRSLPNWSWNEAYAARVRCIMLKDLTEKTRDVPLQINSNNNNNNNCNKRDARWCDKVDCAANIKMTSYCNECEASWQ